MGTLTRKRARAEPQPSNPPSKRRPPSHDSDIDSDDAGSLVPDDRHADAYASSSSEDPAPADETADARRLRLAKAYLEHAGLGDDAPGAPSDGDDAANAQLRDHALRAAGRAVTYLADAFPARLAAAAVARGRGHALAPTCVALSADAATAVSGGKDARVIVWDVATGRRAHTFKPVDVARGRRNPARVDAHVGNVLAVAVTDDGRMAVSGGSDALVRVWDTRVGKSVECLRGHRAQVTGLAFRQNSRQLFSASADRTVKVWDMEDMAYVETLFGHGAEVNAVDSLTKERALSCGKDGTLRLYKVVEGSQLVFRRAMTLSIDAVAMLSEQRFVSGGDDGTVCLWQQSKKKPTATIEKAHGGGLGCEAWISAVAAFRNTDLVASGGGDGKVRFWKCEDVPKLVSVGELDVGPGFVNSIAVGAKHGIMAVAVGNEHRLGRWGKVRGARNTIQFVSLPSD